MPIYIMRNIYSAENQALFFEVRFGLLCSCLTDVR